jgi:pyruvate dehydrogenase E2 component (dihydrolipoamide acetyltransferase)
MAVEIRVPRLGWSMEQGVFLGWLKQDGDPVRLGEPLFTLEGDKAAQDIEATADGILRIPSNGPKPGAMVAVGSVLGYLATADESIPFQLPEAPVAIAAVTSSAAPSSTVTVSTCGLRITPRARRAATQLGIDPDHVTGTGRNGRIRERDVLAAKGRPDRVRRVIAERMVHSLRATAPVTLTTTLDATELVRYRRECRPPVGITDLFVLLVCQALRHHPALNARWQDDHLVQCPDMHIGMAVDTEAGLLVPVVRHADRLSLRDITQRTRQLVDRARAGQLTADEMQGGTFTITNLGPFGIDAFTPIINWPEVAILGLGRIHKQPAVINDTIVPRDMMTLSLTFDHRALDGAPAARFLQTLGAALRGVGSPGFDPGDVCGARGKVPD